MPELGIFMSSSLSNQVLEQKLELEPLLTSLDRYFDLGAGLPSANLLDALQRQQA